MRDGDRQEHLSRLASIDAVETARRVQAGDLAFLDTLSTAMGRINALDEELRVLAHAAFDRVDVPAYREKAAGLFRGVPILLKDMVDCSGLTRSDGAGRPFWRVPSRSPALVQAVEDSGAMILGSTNVPEFATLPVTANQTFGTTRNPWDPARTPGGSSGGSAVAVAAGLVPLAHATDGSGSIRIPASCCGVFGFKPSRERTLSGEADGGHAFLKHHHCLTRSVRDSLAFLAVTEDRTPTARHASVFEAGWPSGDGKTLRRLRLGIDRAGIAGVDPDEAVSRALDDSIALLRGLGHEVLEMRPLIPSGETFWLHLESLFLSRMPALMALVERETGSSFDETSVLSPFTMSFARAARVMPAGAVARALEYFDVLDGETLAWMDGVDAVVSPVLPQVPPAIDRWGPNSDWSEEQASLRAFMNHTPLANVMGAPAMSVPLHWTTQGWPIGTQFMARPGDDRLLFELALELEAARPWADRWPPISAMNG